MAPTSLVRRTVQRAIRVADGWVNALTGLGYFARDKTLSATFEVDMLTDEEAEKIYRGDDMAARIVDKPPGEMLRQGFTVSLDIKDKTDEERAELARAIMGKLDDLKVKPRFGKVLRYERAYGGGGILIGADDGQDLRSPLNLENIRSVDWLTVLHKRELTPVAWYSDSKKDNYGEPERYRINPRTVQGANLNSLSNQEVHASRMIMFTGIEVSETHLANNNGFGDSVLVRCNRVISQFNQSWSSAAVLLADFAQAVIKIKGLAELLAANDCDAVQNRAAGVDLARSVARAIIIDSEEEYERKVTPITGLPEMLQQFAIRLSATANMPVSMLLGQAPTGLNATGDSDIRFFYDDIAEKQNDKVRPPLEYLIKIVLLSKDGPTGGVEPDSWSVEFNSLWQPSQKEQAETRKLIAEGDDLWMQHGTFSPDECATSHFSGATFNPGIVIDMKARKEAARMSTLTEPDDPTTTENDPVAPTTNVTITPTALEAVVSVNEARVKAGYGLKLLANGQPDPDGDLDVDVYRAKKASITAANAAAEQGTTTTPPAPTPPVPAGDAGK